MRIKRNISKTSKPEVAFVVLQEHPDSYRSNPNTGDGAERDFPFLFGTSGFLSIRYP